MIGEKTCRTNEPVSEPTNCANGFSSRQFKRETSHGPFPFISPELPLPHRIVKLILFNNFIAPRIMMMMTMALVAETEHHTIAVFSPNLSIDSLTKHLCAVTISYFYLESRSKLAATVIAFFRKTYVLVNILC